MELQSLTEEKQIILNSFKQIATTQKFDDQYLLRFLVARNFDLQKTQLMWSNFIEWRQKNNIDNIKIYEFKEIDLVRKYYPHGFFQHDKQGRPIYIERIGQIQVQDLFKITNEERLIRYFSQQYEYLLSDIFPILSQVFNKSINKIVRILDLKDVKLGMMPQVKNFISMASQVGQNNYPELLGVMFIINAPMFFHGVWKVMKQFFDQNTQKKIQILGSGYKQNLLLIIDEDKLPNFLGGTGLCNMNENKGPWNQDGLELFGSARSKLQQLEIQVDQVDEQKSDNFQTIISPSNITKSPIQKGTQRHSNKSREFHSINDNLSIDSLYFEKHEERIISFSQNKNFDQNFKKKSQSYVVNDTFEIQNSNNNDQSIKIYKKYLIDANSEKKQQIKELFILNRVYLSPNEINLIVKPLQFQLPNYRQLIFSVYLLLIFVVFQTNYSSYTYKLQVSQHFSCSIQNINLANQLNLFMTGLFSIIKIQKFNKFLLGCFLIYIGIWIKQIKQFEFLLISQICFGIARSLILNQQSKIIKKFILPQERFFSYLLISFFSVFGTVVSFLLPTILNINQIYFIQAIVCSIIMFPAIIIFRGFKNKKIFVQQQKLNQKNKKINDECKKESEINFQILLSIFCLQISMLKAQMFTIDQQYIQEKDFELYQSLKLSFFLIMMLISGIFIRFIWYKSRLIIFFILGSLSFLFEKQLNQIIIFSFANQGLFFITPMILYQVKYQNQKKKMHQISVFIGNIIAIILAQILENYLNDPKDKQIIFCVLMILVCLLIIFTKIQQQKQIQLNQGKITKEQSLEYFIFGF